MSEKIEQVSHPDHYGGQDNPHEVIKCLRAWGLEKDALAWNSAKYVGRAYKKGDPVENFRKAAWYAMRRVAILEGREPTFYTDLFKVAKTVPVLGRMIGDGEIPVALAAGAHVVQFDEKATRDLAQKQYDRGYSDGKAGHSPSLLRGSYTLGYGHARSGRPPITLCPDSSDEEVRKSLEATLARLAATGCQVEESKKSLIVGAGTGASTQAEYNDLFMETVSQNDKIRELEAEVGRLRSLEPEVVEARAKAHRLDVDLASKGDWVKELGSQIDRLANWIMAEVPGEPSMSEGAVETAIRIMVSLRAQVAKLASDLTEARGEAIGKFDLALFRALEVVEGIDSVFSVTAAQKIRNLGSAALRIRPILGSQTPALDKRLATPKLASVCEAGKCDHVKFGQRPCPPLDGMDRCKLGHHLWGEDPTTKTKCASCGTTPGKNFVVVACDVCGAILTVSAPGNLHFVGEQYKGATHVRCRGGIPQEAGRVVRLGITDPDGRCGICLIQIPPGTFMHDCVGEGLARNHYVKRMEFELERLGRGITGMGIEPEGREAAVDAVLRVLGSLVSAVAISEHRGQTDHQVRVERMMKGFGQEVPSVPTMPDEATRVLRARLIMEECLETIQDGLRVRVGEGDKQIDSDLYFDSLVFEAMDGPADMIELADGVADVSVVSIGTLSACGIKDQALLEEVDANNQGKIDTAKVDEFGKFIKHPDHQPPDIFGVLVTQGWTPSPMPAAQAESNLQEPF